MERKAITVKEVLPPKQFTRKNGQPGNFYSFTGEDGVKYESASNTIAEYFVVGKVIDVDIEKVENGQFINHYIRQVYQDGQPVSGQNKGGNRGGYSRDPTDRSSIESQCAAKIIAELWIAGKLSDNSPHISALKMWTYSRLSAQRNPEITTTDQAPNMTAPARKATPDELNKLAEAQKKASKTNIQLQAMIPAEWNIKARVDLTQYQCQTLIDKLQTRDEDLPF